MNWKCDICDTYNEDSVKKCYVCGQPRSIEDIKKEKAEKKKELKTTVELGLFNGLFNFFRVLFIVGLSSASLVALIMAAYILISGNIDDLGYNIAKIFDNALLQFPGFINNLGAVIREPFAYSFEEVFKETIPNAFKYVAGNVGNNISNNVVAVFRTIYLKFLKIF